MIYHQFAPFWKKLSLNTMKSASELTHAKVAADAKGAGLKQSKAFEDEVLAYGSEPDWPPERMGI